MGRYFYIVAACLLFVSSSAQSPASRAQQLANQMNLTEKIMLLHGVESATHNVSTIGYTGATAPIPRLGVPALLLNDGRQGFRPNSGTADQTAFPCQLGVVASFRTDLYYAFGQAMGTEFYGKGANVVLAPMLILARVPQGGRNFESTGEDPLLAYHFAFSHISGVQSVPGVIANADDFVLNNQETARTSINAVCDERTRFETYYRGYKGAVDAGVGSFMCSYNRVNGTYACENGVTLNDLKSPAGLNFTGWVLSDWGGTHSTVAAAMAGLDQEMPSGDYFGDSLYAAVQAGSVPEAVIDDKVLRVLTPMFAAGLFDFPSGGNQNSNVTTDAHNKLARTLSAAGTVLLTNPGNVLPILPIVTSIVVIGDDGDLSPQCCGTGSGGLDPPYIISPYQGILTRAGAGVNVTYLPTPSVPSNLTTFFSATRGDHYTDFECNECYDIYIAVRNEGVASMISFAGSVELQLWYNPDTSSNLVTTAAVPPPTKGYNYIRPLGYAYPLSYNGSLETSVLELWGGMDTPTGAPVKSHQDYWTLGSNASRTDAAGMGYSKVADLVRVLVNGGGADYAQVAAAAAAADIAIVCVSTTSGEGTDRADLDLSQIDNDMIAAITAAQPKSVVVLHNPGAVIMPWVDAAGAIVAAWFPGQEMGNALADILFGDVNPSGRLPLTFPASNADTPLSTPEQYPGVNGTVTYTEGLLFGYRWWDATATKPLFPFGHGLSYTAFTYSNLTIDTASGAPDIIVTASVKNTGPVFGTEISQLYLGFPASAGEPPLLLRGFTALDLYPGESASAQFTLTPRDVSVWDTALYAWALVAGTFQASVGASSRDLRLTGSFTL